ncbi:tetratricopeptide repeat protein [Janthinobacterium sp. PC23-8]|uniref:tetratricopeptide repeat protein n=1 Tax=Janthinobacterium sp. PC23-8 TaxID=2012679 RepID=UPI000B97775C|nr:tetratricopeptide repeat protein [Janthinobacterium sp. PC23-8]OYO31878.1 hypothetical protein CD932_12660 [Janthinobacterium sp. PC23-8]
MKTSTISLLCAASLLAGCATTSDPAASSPGLAASSAQHDACNAAELKGQLAEAELACTRALDSAIKAGAKDELLSQRQYNLGRVKRLLGKHVEAEALYKQALATEEAALPRSDARIGRRLVELASALSAQGKWQEGAAYLERSLPVLHKLPDTSRAYAAEVLQQYAKQLQGGAQAALGRRFMETAAILK